jgi:hypothetical protein
MPPIDPGNLRDLLTALGIVAAALLLWWLLTATPAHAQFSATIITAPGSMTPDQQTEQNSANLLTQNTFVA